MAAFSSGISCHVNPGGGDGRSLPARCRATMTQQLRLWTTKPDDQNAILPSMRISYLECTRCGEHLSADRPQNICPKDGGVVFACYDLASLKEKLRTNDLRGRVSSMWR